MRRLAHALERKRTWRLPGQRLRGPLDDRVEVIARARTVERPAPVGQHLGGNLGGPVFKRIAEQVLAYLDVPHDVPVESDSEFAKKNKGAAEPDDSVVQNDLRAQDRRESTTSPARSRP